MWDIPLAVSTEDPLIGMRVGNYRIAGFIGRGGMGMVYRAFHETLERPAAIKFLPPEMASADPEYVERFLREARAAASLSHPNIIGVFDAGEQDGLYYLAMEYVDGSDLKRILNERGALPEDEVLNHGRAMSLALACAHERGLVHRDIKPENMIMTSGGVLKLADLGLAKQMNENSGLTQAGTVVGTPYYISPEQVRGDEDVDLRTDIYSLGATLFHLATGRPPFIGGSSHEVMSRHLTEMRPSPREVNPSLSPGFDALFFKMMARERDKRYQNMSETAAAIDRCLQRCAMRNVQVQTDGPSPVVESPPVASAPVPPDAKTARHCPQCGAVLTEGRSDCDCCCGRLQLKKSSQFVRPPAPASVVAPEVVQKSSSFAWLAWSVLLLALGLGGWWLIRNHGGRDATAPRHLPPSTSQTSSSPQPKVQPMPPPIPEPDVKNGEERFANGNLQSCGSLKRLPDGRWVKNGLWTNFWANGQINTFGEYRDDEKVGPWPFYLDNGVPMSTNWHKAAR
ncbi:MAG: protein kinase [Verrucomicrobiae bacterium]|nr:protein kinase [Verrucomicrobiae bacterium]